MENLRNEMMGNENNYCIVNTNDRDDILFVGTKEECISCFYSKIEQEDNNGVATDYTIADYEFYCEL